MDFTEFVGKAVFALWAKPKGNRCKSQYVGQGVVWRRSVLADCFSIYYCGNCKVWNLNIKCGPSSRVFSSCTTGNWPSLPTLRRLCPLTLPPAAPAGISADKKREMKWNWAPPLLEEMNRVWIGEQTQQNIWNNSTMYKKRRFFVCCSALVNAEMSLKMLSWSDLEPLWKSFSVDGAKGSLALWILSYLYFYFVNWWHQYFWKAWLTSAQRQHSLHHYANSESAACWSPGTLFPTVPTSCCRLPFC